MSEIRFFSLLNEKENGAVCNLLIIEDIYILLDCGLDPNIDIRFLDTSLWAKINIIVISHPSISHMGLLPQLSSHLDLSKVVIVCTLPIGFMSQMALYDMYYTTKEEGNSPKYSLDEVDRIICEPPMKYLKYWQRYEYSPHIVLSAYPSGRSLGGSVWRITVGMQSIVYMESISLAVESSAMSFGFTQSDARPDVLITNSIHIPIIYPATQIHSSLKALKQHVCDRLLSGGSIIFPSDTSHRVLQLLATFETYFSTKQELKHFPIVYLNHMTDKTIDFVKTLSEYVNDRGGLKNTSYTGIRMCTNLQQVVDIGEGPKLIFCSMPDLSGFSKILLKEMGGDPKNEFIFTSKMGEQSLAYNLATSPSSPMTISIPFSHKIPIRTGLQLTPSSIAQSNSMNNRNVISPMKNIHIQPISPPLVRKSSSQTSELQQILEDDLVLGEIETMGEGSPIGTLCGMGQLELDDVQFSSDSSDLDLLPYSPTSASGIPKINTKRFAFQRGAFIAYNYSLKLNTYDQFGQELDVGQLRILNSTNEYPMDERGELELKEEEKTIPIFPGGRINKIRKEELDMEDYKYVNKNILVQIGSQFSYFPFEEYIDDISLKLVLKGLQPRKIIITNSSQPEVDLLKEFCEQEITQDVHVLERGKSINIPMYSDIQMLKIDEQSFNQLNMSLLQNIQLAKFIGNLHIPQSIHNNSSNFSGILPVLKTNATSEISKNAKFFKTKDFNLRELQDLLLAEGFKALLLDHTLNYQNKVKIIQTGNNFQIEGSFCEEYLKIREIVYSKLFTL